MNIEIRQKLVLAAVIMLLVAQIILAWLSMGPLTKISMFCTVPRTNYFELFGYIHAVFAGLLLLGLISLAWKQARLFYIALVSLALLALPVQARLYDQGYFYCDGP